MSMNQIKNYEANKIEEEILAFWSDKEIYEKAKAKNKGNEKFYFLDGPPYTSGKVHLGTAWNKSLKDLVLRFRRMKGFDVWDRAGYDMHGMPTELAVEKKLGIKHKEEIPNFGVSRFVSECKEFSVENLNAMNRDFRRIGVWMDFDNPYMSIANTYMEGEWWLIKKAHENKRLYEAEKTMHWCYKCSTSLAKHELVYKNIKDNSIFIKFRLKDKENEFLIVWTTTPWTIPFNLGVMANPSLDYVKAKVIGKSGEEIWTVAKNLASSFIKDIAENDFEIIGEMKGSKLEGINYVHPFASEMKQFKELEEKSGKVHTVVMSEEYVDASSGSGLVHMAPGCGPEDYEVGYRNGIPPLNTLDEKGVFSKESGVFSGMTAKIDDDKIIEEIEKKGVLIADKKVEHDYAHCWRCESPIIFRTTTQWFFKIEDMKEKMRELNKSIHWIPDYAGSRNFDNWLSNLRDNGITRQRYWGTPLPVWKCKSCKDYVVIGSIDELRKIAGKLPDDLHKPWIDEVKIKCGCGELKDRVPDILDVWIDAGSASWNCLDYPRNKELFEKFYPPDFILEGIDQIRGWFNLLFVASMVSMNRHPFNSVYMHGFINDAQGRKMSKSLGNYILPDEVISEYGADTFRYYMVGGTPPGEDINYNFEGLKVKSKNLGVLWNLHKYLIELNESNLKHDKILSLNPELDIEEKYILSRLNSSIKKVTELMEQYRLNEVPLCIEELFLDLSRVYIQLVREKSSGSDDEKKTVLYTIYNAMSGIMKIFAPVAPFICEKMHLNLKENFRLKEESVHHYSWPEYDEKLIDLELENDMKVAGEIIQASLALRDKINLGMRWPLREIIVVTKDSGVQRSVNNTKQVIQKQMNVKELIVKETMHDVKKKVKIDYSKLGPEYGDLVPKIIGHLTINSPETILRHIEKDGKYRFKVDNNEVVIVMEHLIIEREVPPSYVEAAFKNGYVYLNKEITPELEAEGFAREITRRIQSLRKKSGLQKHQQVSVFIKTGEETGKILKDWLVQIKSKVSASQMKVSSLEPNKKHEHSSKESIKGREFEIFLEKD